MTPERQRIKIAEACGWTAMGSDLGLTWKNPVTLNAYHKELPDYLNDLNAMAEAKSILNENQRGDFIDALCRVVHEVKDEPGTAMFKAMFSTASQQAEAFLKSLGLWEDEL